MTDPIPDSAVEAAARTLHRLDHEDEGWETAPPRRRDMYTSDARAALAAAAPLIAAQAVADLRARIEALRDEWRARAASLRAVDSYAATLCDEHADALDAWRAGGGA